MDNLVMIRNLSFLLMLIKTSIEYESFSTYVSLDKNTIDNLSLLSDYFAATEK